MGETKLAPRITAAAIWAALALLLWTTGWLIQGRGGSGDAWPVRNAELSALFAFHDQAEAAAAIPAPPNSGPGKAAEPAAAAEVQAKVADSTAQEKMIDLNRASVSELDKLPGIGPSKAKAIVEYREKQGAFRTIEELKQVKGIGDKTFDSLLPFITVEK
ncbi:helix-hairpin-helix domain-containing protein [Paenibacillus hemerocallicola]|uniref:Helix-hairpin-helix domain-containing protein n=1 Tax=Paenibacillus hemerocallicola TaxID=1172614 RepID=A0A5C4TFW1_9BACL|nr:helix-hairpin-helix domain-containing protein [Paenibacillus hemerocallicola]TNJ67931.1 helix-hairpin-helix domain-containing protein [Paenibacillus hemerocallicola]